MLFLVMISGNYGNIKVRGRSPVPVTGREGPCGCEPSRLPHFLDSRLTLSALLASALNPPGRLLVLISVKSLTDVFCAVVLPETI
jgi:hypothetical protein